MPQAREVRLTQEQEAELRHLAASRILAARVVERTKIVLAAASGKPDQETAQRLGIARQTVARWRRRFLERGLEGLKDALRPGRPTKFFPSIRTTAEDSQIKKEAVFTLLHTPPSTYGINRTTWKMIDLHRVMREKGEPLALSKIRTIIKKAGYTWRRARIVLTSNDPNYKSKVDAITAILSQLKTDEAFFSIDEFGPFAVKIQGGQKLVPPGQKYTVPQLQKSKGCLIVTAALDLSRNQVTHFYSERKNTQEMITMMDLLLQHRDRKTIYLSWDAASWHISKRLFARMKDRNEQALAQGYPIVKAAPLPAGAQFLNIIESVFSGMARAVIHNSDYSSVDQAKAAIDKHFQDRNEHFTAHPRRAGRKIWGQEQVPNEFRESNNCKDPKYR